MCTKPVVLLSAKTGWRLGLIFQRSYSVMKINFDLMDLMGGSHTNVRHPVALKGHYVNRVVVYICCTHLYFRVVNLLSIIYQSNWMGMATNCHGYRVLPTIRAKVGNDFIFQHDGASVHTSIVARNFLCDENVQALNYPSLSPDLNPVENLWGFMADHVYDGTPIFNLGQLKDRIDTAARDLNRDKKKWITAA